MTTAKNRTKSITCQDVPSSLAPVRQIYGVDCYDDNPFINASQGFEITTNSRVKTVGITGELRLDEMDTTEKIGSVWQSQTYDLQEFVKFYSGNAGFFFGLTTQGINALTALFFIVQTTAINSDLVFFNHAFACDAWKKMGITKSPSFGSFTKGRNNLLEKAIICGSAKGQGWYFINPSLIFNGDRIAFIKVAILDRSKKVEQLKLQ